MTRKRGRGDYRYEGGFAAALEMFDGPHKPEALFCANDLLAIGAMDAIRKSLGMRAAWRRSAAPRRTPPHRPADVHRDGLGAGEGPMSEQIRVLLVDDQDLFREGVKVIVDAQDGVEVVGTAGDGLEAVRLVDELSPDVVLMDIRMPEMDGVEATRQIFLPDRAARREKPVRVVVLTTFNLDDRAATAIRYGASGFLLKRTTPVMLRDAIRTVHAGNAVLAPDDLSALLDGQFRARTHALGVRVPDREGARGVRCRGEGACRTPRSPAWSSPASRR